MPDTSSLPARSRKLGGIPLGEVAAPGVYRKPPKFKMKPIPLPAAEQRAGGSKRGAAKPKRVGGGGGWLGPVLVGAVLGLGAYYVSEHRAQLLALVRPEPPPPAPPAAPFIPGPAPLDSTPLAETTQGWVWLFDEGEWRVPKDEEREFSGGLRRVKQKMEKAQLRADGAIRARVVVREPAGAASLFLRATAEGRYRLALDADRRTLHLLVEQEGRSKELGKYVLTKLPKPGERLVLELRAETDHLAASVNGAVVIEADDTSIKRAGTWGIEAEDAWFEIVEVPLPKAEDLLAEAKPEPAPAPAADPMPLPVVPAATPAPLSETAKWLAGLEAQWSAAYQRDIVEPYEKSVGGLRQQYLGQLDAPLAAATQARKMDDAAAFRGERQRIGKGEDVPATDDAIVPPALRQMRAFYRQQLARLESDRAIKTKALHAKYDTLLAQNQSALAQRQRAAEAAEIQEKRAQLSAAWLKPAAAPAAAAALASTSGGPVVVRPALGVTTAAPPAGKLTPKQVAEKLLALGAGVWVAPLTAGNQRPGYGREIKSVADLGAERFMFTHVEIRRQDAAEKPITAADLAILDHLDEVADLGLHGPAVTDAAIEKLRTFRNLRQLNLQNCTLTAAAYDILATLPALRELELRGLGSSDAMMKSVGQCRKLQRLVLANLPLTDDAFTHLTKLGALEEIDLNDLDKITSVSITRLAENRGIKRLILNGFAVTTPTLEAVAKCSALEALTLSGNDLKDEQIVPLSGLARLQSLNLSRTKVVGSAFAKWPVRPTLRVLNLGGAPGVNDEAIKGITTSFPKLETLDFNLAALGAKPENFSGLSRLRSLRTMRINGTGVSDEIAAEIGRCGDLYSLDIPGASLSEPGIAALARLDKLSNLYVGKPPVSEAALRSFGKMKALRNVTLAEDTPEEDEKKLRGALPGVAVKKAGG